MFLNILLLAAGGLVQADAAPAPAAPETATEIPSDCPENTPEGRGPDFADCLLKVGMSAREVNKALGGRPTREMPGQGRDVVSFYEYEAEDGSTTIITVVFDAKTKVRFWRTYRKE